MPCDSTTLSSIEFSLENTNFELLKKAMQALWYSSPVVSSTGVLTFTRGAETVTFDQGKITCSYPESRPTTPETYVNCIKRAYSTEVVKSSAKRFGWKLKEKVVNGNTVFEVQKGL